MGMFPVNNSSFDANNDSPNPPNNGVENVITKLYSYEIDKINKVVNIWMIGEIYYDVSEYGKLISLFLAAAEDYVVHFYIHSPGGAISTACHLLSAMTSCKATVITHNLGLAASCGSLILAFGNKIEIAPNAVTMFHASATGNFDASHRVLTKTKHLIEYVNFMFELMHKRGLVSTEEVTGIVTKDEEYYFTSTEMNDRLKVAGILYEGGK